MNGKLTQWQKIWRWTLGLLGALIVGALGNGLWEFAIKAGLVWLGSSLLEISGHIWGGYLDSLYEHVGANYSDQLSLLPFVMTLSLLATLPLLSALRFHSRTKELNLRLERLLTGQANPNEPTTTDIDADIARIQNKIERLKPVLYRIYFPLTVFITGMSITMAAETMYVRKATNWTGRSIEILAPLLTPLEHAQLRSNFRAVQSSKQFFALESSLQAIAATNGKKLPPFDPIGRP